MSDYKRIGAKIVIDGEKEYQKALSNAKAATTQFKSELSKLATEFAGNEKSIDALRSKQEAYRKTQESLEKTTQILSTRLQEASEVRTKESAVLEKNKNELEGLRKELDKTKSIYGENSKEVQELSKQIEVSEKNIKQQESALVTLDTQISRYNTELNKTETELVKVSRELDDTTKELKEADGGFKIGKNTLELFQKGAESAGNTLKGFNESFKNFVTMAAANLASDAIRSIGRGLADMATNAIGVGAAFESSMSTVAATMSLSEKEIATASGRYKILEDSARKMGATTKYTASEAAEALNYLALAGYNAEKAAQALPTVLNLAAAGAMDLGYTSDLVTDSMSALSIGMNELEGFTDQMAVTAQKSNTNVAQLGEAILVVGGTAKQLAGGTVELNTALGILADNGIKGAEGGTALRNVLKNLLTPTEKAQDAMDALNFSAYNADGSIRPLNETMLELSGKLDGLSDKKRNEILSQIFDVRNLKSAEALMSNAGKRFDELSGYISNAEGAAARMAYTMSNNLTGKMKTFQSASEELGISIYKKLEEPLKSAVDSGINGIGMLTNEVNSGKLGASLDQLGYTIEGLAEKGVEIATEMLPKLIDGSAWLVDNLDLVVTGVEALITAYVAYEAASTAATIATELFGTTLSATPIGLAAGAIAGLVVVLSNLDQEMDNTAKKTKDHADVLDTVTGNLDSVVESGDKLLGNIEAQKALTNDLIQELDELNKKEELNDFEKRRIRDIVRILNGQYQGLNLLIDENTGKTIENSDAIRGSVEEIRKLELSQKIYEEIVKAHDKETDALISMKEAEIQLQKAQEERTALQEKIVVAQDEYNQKMIETNGLAYEEEQAIYDLTDQEYQLSEQIKTLSTSLDECNSKYDEAHNHTELLKEVMEEETNVTFDQVEAENQLADSMSATAYMSEELSGEIDGLGNEVDDLASSTDNAKEAFSQFIDDYTNSLESGLKKNSDIFSEFKGAQEVDLNEMWSNMRSNIDGVDEWGKSYETLASKIGTSADEALLFLGEMGVEGKSLIDQMLTLSDEELGMFIADMQTALTLPDNVTADLVNDYIDVADSIVTGLTGSLQEEAKATGRIDVATTQVADRVTKTIEEQLQIHNYRSGVLYDQGFVIPKKIATGMEDNKGETENAAQDVADTIERTSRNELSTSTFENIGEQVDYGLANGILYNDGMVYDAIRRVCDRAVDEAYRRLEINSPSKVFEEIGEYTGEGFVKGWDSKADEMVGSINSVLGDAVPNAARNEVSNHNVSVGAPVINVYGAQGQDINQLADIIGNRWNLWMHQAAGVWR
ncbi:MAG: phage tail tape measure protein [Lachnospiraceae bacterium]|nr:phage tail tape measure protein [Lachnospiraceae bacterium]